MQESPVFIGFLSIIASRSQQISQQSALVHRTYRAATYILPHREMFHNLARGAGKADGSREVEMRAPHTVIHQKKFRTLWNCKLCYGDAGKCERDTCAAAFCRGLVV